MYDITIDQKTYDLVLDKLRLRQALVPYECQQIIGFSSTCSFPSPYINVWDSDSKIIIHRLSSEEWASKIAEQVEPIYKC